MKLKSYSIFLFLLISCLILCFHAIHAKSLMKNKENLILNKVLDYFFKGIIYFVKEFSKNGQLPYFEKPLSEEEDEVGMLDDDAELNTEKSLVYEDPEDESAF